MAGIFAQQPMLFKKHRDVTNTRDTEASFSISRPTVLGKG